MAGEVCARTDFDRMEQLAATEYNKKAVETIKVWRALVENSRPLSSQTRIEHANRFVNSHAFYASDMEVWGMEDYWATPLELFGKGEGDCEDFAIAKYVTLLLMDIPVQKLRLVYVRARMGSQTLAHMVLTYFETPTSDPLILDNLTHEVLPATRRPDLSPVFSFNHEGLWMEGEKTRHSADRPARRLSNWRRVLQRMRSEGIDPSWTSIDSRSVSSWKLAKLRPSLQKITMLKSGSKKKMTKSGL
ncbi:MAG: transglutaminase-like cysteine peptidase, partial [Azoarcus sp.]|nr:transglutaminase-like cysteine peptidase [Azoarcus sp.]